MDRCNLNIAGLQSPSAPRSYMPLYRAASHSLRRRMSVRDREGKILDRNTQASDLAQNTTYAILTA